MCLERNMTVLQENVSEPVYWILKKNLALLVYTTKMNHDVNTSNKKHFNRERNHA